MGRLFDLPSPQLSNVLQIAARFHYIPAFAFNQCILVRSKQTGPNVQVCRAGGVWPGAGVNQCLPGVPATRGPAGMPLAKHEEQTL